LSLSLTISCLTPGEAPGRDYHFISHAKFLAMTAKGEFAESASVHDFFYGTPARTINRAMATGRDLFLDIDVQGARQIKQKYPEAVSIFLLPPSWRELKRRLGGRATDDRAIIRRRLANARREIQDVIQYDYYIVNSDIREAVATLEAIILAERQKISRIRAWGLAPLRRPIKIS